MQKLPENEASSPLTHLAPYYLLSNASLYSSVVFSLSHSYCNWTTKEVMTEKEDWTLWSCILPGLFLGQIPVKNSKVNQALKIKEFVERHDPNRPLSLVFSVLDYFELAGKGLWYAQTIGPEEWQQMGIKHDLLVMSDFGAQAPDEMILKAVATLRAEVSQGRSVFIHCKAGKGRSAMLVLIYLGLYGDGDSLAPNAPFETLLSYLKEKRIQVNMSASQLAKARQIIEDYHRGRLNADRKVQTGNYVLSPTDLSVYLSSVEAKDAIRCLTSFKELAKYAMSNSTFMFGKCHRSEYIKSLFSAIYYSADGAWFYQLMRGHGPLAKFMKAQPNTLLTGSDEGLRQQLAAKFKEDLTQLLAQKLNSTTDAIKTLVADHAASYSNETLSRSL